MTADDLGDATAGRLQSTSTALKTLNLKRGIPVHATGATGSGDFVSNSSSVCTGVLGSEGEVFREDNSVSGVRLLDAVSPSSEDTAPS